MSLLSDDESDRLRELLADELTADVRLIHFTQHDAEPAEAPRAAADEPPDDEGSCTSCADTEELLAELVATNDHLALEVHDVAAEPALAEEFDIERVPATLIAGPGAQGTLRVFGLPSGYEFATLLEDLIDVSAEQRGPPAGLRHADLSALPVGGAHRPQARHGEPAGDRRCDRRQRLPRDGGALRCDRRAQGCDR